MNIYKQEFMKFKRYVTIPDKYASKAGVKGWADFCYKKPDDDQITQWCMEEKLNLALPLGEINGVIALDVDTDDVSILEKIESLFPDTPCKKRGAKGYTLFYRYMGEQTDKITYNGACILELLSTGKKTTIPPSIHPNGCTYVWEGTPLYEIDPKDLPVFPPFLFSNIKNKLQLLEPSLDNGSNKLVHGRNNALGAECGRLISERVPLNDAISQLIKFDKENHEVPLFTDPMEMPHTEPHTNALQFYCNHLQTANRKNYRDSKEYEVPLLPTSISDKEISSGKSVGVVVKKSLPELPPAPSVLRTLQLNILENSWIKQPAFALGASLSLMSTLVSRKLVYKGISPNLYILNIGKSGSGKNVPQQKVKETLIDIGAASLLGAGDYVSDASLMDSFDSKPVRLDIMDEAGGILRAVNEGGSGFNNKMADILAELFTSSDSHYLGRATADGNKGDCYRPNVNILASTTPTGFSEGVSITAIQKGLLGRFLMFEGNDTEKAQFLEKLPRLDEETKDRLRYWYGYKPEPNNNYTFNNITYRVKELTSTPEAEALLGKFFAENDDLRINLPAHSALLPIVARLYTMLVKVAIISCAARTYNQEPVINRQDVEFAKQVIDYCYGNIQEIVRKYVFSNKNERNIVRLLGIIEDNRGITKKELFQVTKDLSKRERDTILTDLIENGEVMASHVGENLAYFKVEDN